MAIHGIWDDIKIEYGKATGWIETETTAAGEAIGRTVADVSGWLTKANDNIAAGKAILDQLQASNQATSKDQSMYDKINQKQIDLTNELQNDVQSQLAAQNEAIAATPEAQAAVPALSETASVEGQLLPLSGIHGMGIIPLIVAGGAVLVAGGYIADRIYTTYEDSKTYLTYMQARQQAVQNGTSLPPLPPSLAKYQSTSSVKIIAYAAIGLTGAYVAYKIYRHFKPAVHSNPRRYHRNPYSSRARYIHHDIESASDFDPRSIRTIHPRKGVEIRVGCPKGYYHHGKCSVGTRAVSELVSKNPKKSEYDPIAADELKLYVDNTGSLYRGLQQTIEKNLKDKMDKGIYDPSKAVKAWMYLIDEGARRYKKELGKYPSAPSEFNKTTREAVAKAMAEDFELEQNIVKKNSMNNLYKNPSPESVFKTFHGFEPTKIKDVTVPDNYPDELVLIGKAHEVRYESNKINGAPNKDGKHKHYVHDLPKGSLWATDKDGKGLYLIDDKLQVKPEGLVH